MSIEIRGEIKGIEPLDALEARTRMEVLAWVDSGVELCRIAKPATPRKHLVSYVAVIDGDYQLLVDHINAELWLPPGGHVEAGEHPRTTALREAKEELGIKGEFLVEGPVLVTSTTTVGKTAGHTDVSLWYALKGDRSTDISFDAGEFHGATWFHKDAVPMSRTDPHMKRFITKLYGLTG